MATRTCQNIIVSLSGILNGIVIHSPEIYNGQIAFVGYYRINKAHCGGCHRIQVHTIGEGAVVMLVYISMNIVSLYPDPLGQIGQRTFQQGFDINFSVHLANIRTFLYICRKVTSMTEKNILIPIHVYSYDELSDTDRRLVDMAREATTRSYAPYSHFRVGAALLLDNGEIVTGSNQENAAYPSGTCAERTTAYYAHSTYPQARFDTLCVAARGTDGAEVEEPISPCGACRQALVEYEKIGGRPVRMLLAGRHEIYELPSIASSLPLTFDSF